MDGHDRRFVLLRQRHSGWCPWRIDQPAFFIAACQATGRKHDNAALGLESILRPLQGDARLFTRPLGFNPFDRDQRLGKTRIDAQGIGIGEENSVRPTLQNGVIDRDSIGDAGWVVANDETAPLRRQPVEMVADHIQRQQIRDIVERFGPGHTSNGISHTHRLMAPQDEVKHRPDYRPR